MIFKNHDEIMFKWLGGCSKHHPYWIYTKNANKNGFWAQSSGQKYLGLVLRRCMAHIIGFVREFYDRNHEWTIHMWKISWSTSLPISRWNRGYFSRQNCCCQDPYTMGHSYWLTNRTPNNTFQHAAGPYLCKIQPADPAHLTQPKINTAHFITSMVESVPENER